MPLIVEVSLRGTFVALQFFGALFLSLFGLGELFRGADSGERFLGAALAALGLTFLTSFLTLLAVNKQK
jgi:hypothetical protein